MSNISQASKNIKKKLSFDDYSKPAEQKAVMPEACPSKLEERSRGKQTSEPAHPHTGAPAGQQDLTTAILHNSKPSASTGKHTGMPHKLAQQPAGKMVQQYAGMSKVKATFYLSENDNQLLIDMFIKRLQVKNKTDKSALISEAIQLLYKREMK